jgi:hypothetical protein
VLLPSFKIPPNPPLLAITFRALGDVPPTVVPVASRAPPFTTIGVPSLTTVVPLGSTPRKLPVTRSLLLVTEINAWCVLIIPARLSPLIVEPSLE